MAECCMFKIAAASQMPSWPPDLLCPSDPKGAERVRGNIEGREGSPRKREEQGSQQTLDRRGQEGSRAQSPASPPQLLTTGFHRAAAAPGLLSRYLSFLAGKELCLLMGECWGAGGGH